MSEQDLHTASSEKQSTSLPLSTIPANVARIQAENALCDVHRLLTREIEQRAAAHVHALKLPPVAAPALDACFDHVAKATSRAVLSIYKKVSGNEPETMTLLTAYAEKCDSGRDWALRFPQTLEEEGLAAICAPLSMIADEALGLTPLGSSEARADIIEHVTNHVTEAFQAALSNTVGMALENIPICNPHDTEEGFDLAIGAFDTVRNILTSQENAPRFKNLRTKTIFDSMRFALDTPMLDIQRALKKEHEGFLAGDILSQSGYTAPLEVLTETAPFCDTPKGGILCELHATLAGVRHNLLENKMFMLVGQELRQEPLATPDDPGYKAARRLCQWRLDKALAYIEDKLFDASSVSDFGKQRLKTTQPHERLSAPFVLQ